MTHYIHFKKKSKTIHVRFDEEKNEIAIQFKKCFYKIKTRNTIKIVFGFNLEDFVLFRFFSYFLQHLNIHFKMNLYF